MLRYKGMLFFLAVERLLSLLIEVNWIWQLNFHWSCWISSKKYFWSIFSSFQNARETKIRNIFIATKPCERTKGATSKHVLSVSNKLIQNRWNIERRTKPIQLPRSLFLQSHLLFLRKEYFIIATEIERLRILILLCFGKCVELNLFKLEDQNNSRSS